LWPAGNRLISATKYRPEKTRTSAYAAAGENVTVTVLLLDEAIFEA
jgi:hypothetical protein